MRLPTNYHEFISEKHKYDAQGISPPQSFYDTYLAQWIADSVWRSLDDYADGGALSKVGWEWFQRVKDISVPEQCSMEWKQCLNEVKSMVHKCHEDLLTNESVYFLDGYTLTKAGRKRIREAQLLVGQIIQKEYKR